MIREAFSGKAVLVTGHTGFKGSWLAHWLGIRGARVVGYALEPYSDRDNYVASGVGGAVVDSVIADIRDAERLAAEVKRHEPEVVFHLAAQPLVRYSYEHPAETYDTNVVGTANLLHALAETGSAKATVVVTSDKAYYNDGRAHGYTELDALGGHDPYSTSKACQELVAASFREAYFRPSGMPLATARAGNVIGGGDWAADRIVPDAIRALEAGQPVGVRNPDSTRPWQHVLEPLGGYLLLAARMLAAPTAYCEPFNFGPDPSAVVTVRELVERLVGTWGGGSWAHTPDPAGGHEAALLALDATKAKARLGWAPALGIDETVAWTAEWYRTRAISGFTGEVAARQIDEHERRAEALWGAAAQAAPAGGV